MVWWRYWGVPSGVSPLSHFGNRHCGAFLVHNRVVSKPSWKAASLTVRGQREVLATGVANEPGVLGGLARRFAEAGINIDLVYMAADTRIVLGVDDMDAGRSLI